jgi:hypothetical protein
MRQLLLHPCISYKRCCRRTSNKFWLKDTKKLRSWLRNQARDGAELNFHTQRLTVCDNVLYGQGCRASGGGYWWVWSNDGRIWAGKNPKEVGENLGLGRSPRVSNEVNHQELNPRFQVKKPKPNSSALIRFWLPFTVDIILSWTTFMALPALASTLTWLTSVLATICFNWLHF